MVRVWGSVCVLVVVFLFFPAPPPSPPLLLPLFPVSFFIFITPVTKHLIWAVWFSIQIDVSVCFHTTFYVLLNALCPRGRGAYFFAFKMVAKIEPGIAYLQSLNLGWGTWIVSRRQVRQHCGCVLRREVGLRKHLARFCPVKIPPLCSCLQAAGSALNYFYFWFPFCGLLWWAQSYFLWQSLCFLLIHIRGVFVMSPLHSLSPFSFKLRDIYICGDNWAAIVIGVTIGIW